MNEPKKRFWYKQHDEGEFRLVLLHEGIQGFSPFGSKSNMPGELPPIELPSEKEAREMCLYLNARDFGVNEEETLRIVATTMSIPECQVIRDPETDMVTILLDGETLVELEGEIADDLYLRLGKALSST